MTFTPPNASVIFDNAVSTASDDGHSSDYLGHGLITKSVNETIPAYDEILDFRLITPAQERHERLGGLAFGRINKDIARLRGLHLAIDNISATIRAGKEQLGQDWKGESYETFKLHVEKIEKTLGDYSVALETTANGLSAAMAGIEEQYREYRDGCLETYFNWGNLAAPKQWRRMTRDDANFLADNCGSCGFATDCGYNNNEYIAIIDDKPANDFHFKTLTLEWCDCTRNDDVVSGQYNWVVDGSEIERDKIHEKIDKYCLTADGVKKTVDEAYDVAFENLRIISEVKVFSHLQIAGAVAPAGGDPVGGGSPGGGGGGYPGGGGGGGSYGGGGSPEVAMPPVPTPEPVADPAAVAPVPEEPTVPAGTEAPAAGETVEIKDGDRTIAVTSPDGQGHVKVTVENADGTTKSYDLDFDAASGLLPFGAETPEPAVGPDGQPLAEPAGADNVQQVPARTDGKCVIEDGPLTITAERPLFAPDSIRLVVDDGTGEPSSYLVDFEGQPEPPAEAAAAPVAPSGQPVAATEEALPSGTTAAPAGEVDEEPVDTPEPAAATDEPAAAVAEEPEATPEPEPAPTSTEHVTSPQAVAGDDIGSRGAMSGQLSGDIGDAQLSSAEDASSTPAAGMAPGMPMLGNAGDGPAESVSRAGAGWSVHGDLFDSGEPVYSMHGVLGDDDSDQQ